MIGESHSHCKLTRKLLAAGGREEERERDGMREEGGRKRGSKMV